ncbi:MAG: hypothetical protein EXS47_00785 [Candidatus Zambryskibacteria bacterium]|nr:hypothetical protein [Candidatus Zambryskibacteria bacterium]
MKDFGYNKEEIKIFRKLSSPQKIQDFLNSLPFNFEKRGETCMSPRKVLDNKLAHCMEGAILAAAALEFHGAKPILLDLRSTEKPYDFDHVVAVFKIEGCFGAISKTNHSVLRYREPIYKTLRELVLSYFHEYFLNSGQKTLREYSVLLDLNKFNKLNWRTSNKNLFEIPEYLDKVKHHKILTSKQIRNLRKADKVEIELGKIVEYLKK